MYHCRLNFYLMGHMKSVFEIIKGMPPLEHFTHEFFESDEPEEALLAKADVIVADFHCLDVSKSLKTLIYGKKQDSELILIADKDQTALLSDSLPEIKDIWTAPMSEEEVKFRFLRWQQTFKMSKDYWETSHFFESTINNIPNLVWYKDKNGIHEKVNNSFCQTVNKPKECVEGQGHAYIWDVEHDDPACIESENKVMTTRKTYVSEETILTGEGERILTTYKSPLYDIDGSVMGTVGVAIDITKERAYEQELVKKSESLETLFATVDCGILCHTVDGTRIISVNRAALEILGYNSKEELVENGFDMVASNIVSEDKDKIKKCMEQLKKEGDSVSVEYRVEHADGKILHVMGNIKLLSENGELFYQRFLVDCTAQKVHENTERTENERRQRELIYALSINYNLVCYFDIDTGLGMPLSVDCNDNHMLNSIFDGEISLEESMDLYIDRFVYEDDKEMLRQSMSRDELRQKLEEKNQYYVNYRTYKDGKVVYFQIKAIRIGAWNNDRGIVVGFRSVDEEIRDEMEKKRMLEDALLQANRASKAKSIFLSNMSHDIRTPMNAIVGFTSLAMTHINNHEQVKEYLKKIMTSGNHLLSLINDILDMSRIESGKMHLEEKLCSLPDILHGLRNILIADINSKQLELYIDTVDVLDEEIYCDNLRLNQVLLNLLSNAIKYTGAGGIISMRIKEKQGAPAGCAYYEFCIKDTGIGMSREFVEHIFEPFERERNSTISGIQGTGLGMAITKNIVDMMNGTIEVKSEQNAGTEVTVSFMFKLNEGSRESQIIPELKNCSALVVDDDFNTCDSVSYMLEQIGMRAEWTLSGKEAVLRTRRAVMRNEKYDVYIIDWLIPDMNGIEVARRIKKEIGEDVPIIVLTAYDWSDIEDEAREAGVTAFCSKPLFLSELRDCLRSVISGDDESNDNEELITHYTGHILLAEDNKLNQEIASEILSEAGFTLDIADNGQIAVDMLKKSKPGYYQLVLMDVQMPVMNGYDATKLIRNFENKSLASIPILAMTANAFDEDRQEALRAGMNGHIAKPIDPKKLFEILDKVLSECE